MILCLNIQVGGVGGGGGRMGSDTLENSNLIHVHTYVVKLEKKASDTPLPGKLSGSAREFESQIVG